MSVISQVGKKEMWKGVYNRKNQRERGWQEGMKNNGKDKYKWVTGV